jgi:hypothetical protein
MKRHCDSIVILACDSRRTEWWMRQDRLRAHSSSPFQAPIPISVVRYEVKATRVEDNIDCPWLKPVRNRLAVRVLGNDRRNLRFQALGMGSIDVRLDTSARSRIDVGPGHRTATSCRW